MKKGEGKMIKNVCTEILPIHRKKKEFKIPLANVRLLGGSPWQVFGLGPQIKIKKNYFLTQRKKWSIFSETCGRTVVSIPPYSILCTLQNQNWEFQDNVHYNQVSLYQGSFP